MALSATSTAKDVVSAIVAGSAIVQACRVYRQVPVNWIFERIAAAQASALGFVRVDVTPAIVDQNGKPFVSVDETFTGALSTKTFTAATFPLATTAAIAGVEALIAAQLLQGELPGPRIRVFFGRLASAVSNSAISKAVALPVAIVTASDTGPAGRFVVTPSAVQTAQVKT